MSQKAVQGIEFSDGDMDREVAFSPPPIPYEYPKLNIPSEKRISNSPNRQNQLQMHSQNQSIPSKQAQIEQNNKFFINIDKNVQMQNQTPQNNQPMRQYSPQNKQHYQQITPPINKITKNYLSEDQIDSPNKSSHNKNNQDDLLEFEILEQQVNMQRSNDNNEEDFIFQMCQNQKFTTRDNILSNISDTTAQEILNAAATPNNQSIEKKIMLKPNLKKTYMSLEQLQMKCQIQNKNDSQQQIKNDYQILIKNDGDSIINKNNSKNEEINYDSQNNDKQYENSNIQDTKNQFQDQNDSQDIFNKFALEYSESIDQQTDSFQQILERAFKSKLRHESSPSSDHNHLQIRSKPPLQLEKQILSSLPPPSPINVQNSSHVRANSQQSGIEPNNKVQQQFSNILDNLKKTNSTSTLLSSHTPASKSFSQQNSSNIQYKSENKTPTSNPHIPDYESSEKVHQYEQIQMRKAATPQISNKKSYTNLGEFNQNKDQDTFSQKYTLIKNLYEVPLIGKSLSQTNIPTPVLQKRSVSLATAQDFAKIITRKRSSSRRMSSKDSVGSIERKQSDGIEIKDLNNFFTNIESDKNDFDIQRSMSNQKTQLRNSNSLTLRLNQDFERRRAIQHEQLVQKELKSKKSFDEIKKQNISQGKLSKDQEKTLVNKLYDDANRRQNIQAMQKKMKEEQREKSLEAQNVIKKGTNNQSNSQYSNVKNQKPNQVIVDDHKNAFSYAQIPVQKHGQSKNNQNRAVSPLLKRNKQPQNDQKTSLNKTQQALQQFQIENKDDHLYKQNTKQQITQQGNCQQNKLQNSVDQSQFQSYSPSKQPSTNYNFANNTVNKKDSEENKISKPFNNSSNPVHTNSKQQKPQTFKPNNKDALEFYQNHSYQPIEEEIEKELQSSIAPSSVETIQKHLNNIKQNLFVNNDNTDTQQRVSNFKQALGNQSGTASRSLSKKPKITIDLDEDEQSNNQFSHYQNSSTSSSQKGINQQQLSATPQSNNNNVFTQYNTSHHQHSNSSQTPSYVSMKCTDSFFKQKNPSTLSMTNQNIQKINKQMSYQYSTGNQTSKNSSTNQNQQQSLKNSNLFPCKTPSNSSNNGASIKKKFQNSFINQPETPTDDQKLKISKQPTNTKTNNQNISKNNNLNQNKQNTFDKNFEIPQQVYDCLSENFPKNNNNSTNGNQETNNFNKFIQQNPNFIQFMMEQYNLVQQNNMANNVQQMQMNYIQMMNQFNSQQNQQQSNQNQFKNNMEMNTVVNQQSMKDKKENKPQLTVDDLLDLDQQPQEKQKNLFDNSPIKLNSNHNGQESKLKQQNLISLSEIDDDQSKNNNGQENQAQKTNFQQNSQINQIQPEDQSGKMFGSFQNFGNSGQKFGKNIHQNNQYFSKSSNSLEYQDNEIYEQNFQPINQFNFLMKSQNTLSSSNCTDQKNSNCVGGNNTTNSNCEQIFSNQPHHQKHTNQQIVFN